jgi:hypothetical protein
LTESLPLLLKSIVKPIAIPWNPTVRKRMYYVLEEIRGKNERAMAKASQVAFEPVNLTQKDNPSQFLQECKKREPAAIILSNVQGKYHLPSNVNNDIRDSSMPPPPMSLAPSRKL